MRRAAPWLLGLLLAGCAVAPVVEEGAWETRRAHLLALDDWAAQGRLSVTLPDESVQGRFQWRQRQDWLEARFRGPLGVGGVFIYGPPEHLTAIGRDGETLLLTDPEHDLRALLGHPLPVQSMRRWLLGLADPAYPHAWRFDDDGLPVHLDQRAWQVEYHGWREYDGQLMPRRIDMNGEDVAIRIVLDQWRADPDRT